MSKSAYVIRHVPFEDLGLLEAELRHRDYEIDYCDAPLGRIEPNQAQEADLLIVLGGPLGVNDAGKYPFLQEEREVVTTRVQSNLPTLGICLGAQLMAAALGSEIAPAERPEIGFGPLRLTGEGRDSVLAPLDGRPVLHWHSETFGTPDSAQRLAETDACSMQAFQLGEKLLGLQFHIEVEPERIEAWLVGHAHELASEGVDVEDLRRGAQDYAAELRDQAHEVFSAWLEGLG
jgi:GMP synthase (glutamine-hydrolysing)